MSVEVPWIINLELTNACNLACIFCDHSELKKNMPAAEMDQSLLEKIFSDLRMEFMHSKIYELGLVGLGEPTLARNLPDYIEIINSHSGLFERISFNSNMVSCSKKIAEFLLSSAINAYTFSVNASNSETYKKLMSRDHFLRVIENVKIFLAEYLKKGSTASLDIQVFDAEGNSLAELESALPEAVGAGVNFFVRKVYTKPVLRTRNSGLRIHKQDAGRRYPCWDIYSRIYIDVEGNLYPCTIGNDCYRENSSLCLGNVNDAPVLELFNNSRAESARRRFELGELGFPECEICNIWSLTPNNFCWQSDKGRWIKNEKQVRAYGLKE